MRKLFKMGLAICMVLVLLFSLAACSGGGRNSGGTGDGSGSDSGGIGSADVGEVGDDGIGDDSSGSGSANHKEGGMYVYDIGGCEGKSSINIDKYISSGPQKGFFYIDIEGMIRDAGWEPYGKTSYSVWKPRARIINDNYAIVIVLDNDGQNVTDDVNTLNDVSIWKWDPDEVSDKMDITKAEKVSAIRQDNPSDSIYIIEQSRFYSLTYAQIAFFACGLEAMKSSCEPFMALDGLPTNDGYSIIT